ncbi:MAG TPA: hypothetical protein DD711_06205 [Acidimicrobium sp.]|nr:hypothetical protein [Acidimicrobium sp.]
MAEAFDAAGFAERLKTCTSGTDSLDGEPPFNACVFTAKAAPPATKTAAIETVVAIDVFMHPNLGIVE